MEEKRVVKYIQTVHAKGEISSRGKPVEVLFEGGKQWSQGRFSPNGEILPSELRGRNFDEASEEVSRIGEYGYAVKPWYSNDGDSEPYEEFWVPSDTGRAEDEGFFRKIRIREEHFSPKLFIHLFGDGERDYQKVTERIARTSKAQEWANRQVKEVKEAYDEKIEGFRKEHEEYRKKAREIILSRLTGSEREFLGLK